MKTEYPLGFEQAVKGQFRYDPVEGKLYKKFPSDKLIEREVTTRHPAGNLLAIVVVDKRQIMVPGARIAFYLHEGRWPGRIKYIDGNNHNMKWDNIVEASEYRKVKSEEVERKTETIVIGKPAASQPPVKSRSSRILPNGYPDDWTPDQAFRELAELDGYIRERSVEIAACLPVFAEIDLATKEYEKEWKESWWRKGLWTGIPYFKAVQFYHKVNEVAGIETSPDETAKEKIRTIDLGKWFTLDKVDRDRLTVGGMMYSISKGIMRESDADKQLASYTDEDEPVAAPVYLREKIIAGVLAKHGFVTMREAVMEACRLWGQRREEERVKELRELNSSQQ